MVTMRRRMVTKGEDADKRIQEHREQPHTLVFWINHAVADGFFVPFLSLVCLLVKKQFIQNMPWWAWEVSPVDQRNSSVLLSEDRWAIWSHSHQHMRGGFFLTGSLVLTFSRSAVSVKEMGGALCLFTGKAEHCPAGPMCSPSFFYTR